MERCPNCRARYDGSDRCRRCGMELGLLVATGRAADALLRDAIAAIAVDDLPAAEHALRHSVSLKRGPLAEALLALMLERRRWPVLVPRRPVAEPRSEEPSAMPDSDSEQGC
jgi:hypothetical protein